jgi:DNA-binding NarL/FixJ family response regulator
MRIQVAVWDPLPLYRRGVMAILSDLGLLVDCQEEPEDVVAWSAGQDRHVALITVDASRSDRGWNAVARLKGLESESKLIVVAVLADDTLDAYVRAIVTGATSAVARNAGPEVLCQVFLEAVQGRSLLPAAVVAALVSRVGPSRVGPVQAHERPSEQHLEWLRYLSKGVSIAELAQTIGYSERAMYRLLKDLYATIGARNRTEALIKASQGGWI